MTLVPSPTRERLWSWLQEEGYELEPVELEGPEAPSWAFTVRFRPSVHSEQPALRMAVVGRDGLERVDVLLDVTLSEEHRRALNADSYQAKLALAEIRSKLFLKGIGLAFHQQEGETAGLRLDDVLYLDGLGRDAFMGVLRRLYAAMIFAADAMDAAADAEGRP